MRRTCLSIALLLGAAGLWVFKDYTYGITFMMGAAAVGCVGLAFILFLTGPFKNPKHQRLAKRLLSLILVLAILGSISFVWIEALIFHGAAGDPSDDADLLVVLGAGLNGLEPSAVLTSRLKVTYDYMVSHPDSIAILTGSQGYNEMRTEASAMAEYLIDRDIAPDRLILEEEAHNTAQNIKYSVALMHDLGLEDRTVMVVSNEFHLYRAERIFVRYDMDVYSLPAPTPKIGLIPLNSYTREYCSVVVMYAKDLLGIDE
ncbi:MAG: YdcF family protein [Clostridia bacterium]|nr:YdcF family protein [Clostridia bacterium]